jgi:predicted DNA-binding transcriptional regulator YafY
MPGRRPAAAVLCLGLAGCVPSADPAQGGFFNGIAGVAGGGYDARVAEREQAVAAAEQEGAALSAELTQLEAQHAVLGERLRAQQASLARRGVDLPPATEARIVQAAAEPRAGRDAARVTSLQRAISEMEALSAQLAAIPG